MEEDVARQMFTLSRRERWRLLDAFEAIASRPFTAPVRQVSDGDVSVSVRNYGAWEVKYWIDHATQQVVIVEICPLYP